MCSRAGDAAARARAHGKAAALRGLRAPSQGPQRLIVPSQDLPQSPARLSSRRGERLFCAGRTDTKGFREHATPCRLAKREPARSAIAHFPGGSARLFDEKERRLTSVAQGPRRPKGLAWALRFFDVFLTLSLWPHWRAPAWQSCTKAHTTPKCFTSLTNEEYDLGYKFQASIRIRCTGRQANARRNCDNTLRDTALPLSREGRDVCVIARFKAKSREQAHGDGQQRHPLTKQPTSPRSSAPAHGNRSKKSASFAASATRAVQRFPARHLTFKQGASAFHNTLPFQDAPWSGLSPSTKTLQRRNQTQQNRSNPAQR